MSPHTIDITLIACLSRLCQALNQIARKVAKGCHLSPEQMKILLYLRSAVPATTTVTELSHTFLVQHSTISESVAVLLRRNLVRRVPIGPGRKARLELTPKGRIISEDLSAYSLPIKEAIEALTTSEKIQFLHSLLRVILGFQQKGNFRPVRLCLNCVHFHPNQFRNSEAPHHCDDYDIPLATSTFSLQCPEYSEATRAVRRKNWEAVMRNSI